ncbi:MAG: damage-inducible protein CinA, partial [Alistipes sp.]|nr:damage-inducible protein CinA [Alistipes sp.]
MKATIITIGDEILIGQIVDTNSVSIAKYLNSAGITVAEKISIGDNAEQIEQTLRRALATTQVVIITGGLGPTKDDITKYTLAKFFSSDFREDDAVARHVKTMLEARGIVY